jgi:WD40 repeat protein
LAGATVTVRRASATPPPHADEHADGGDHECFVPKKTVFRWPAQPKGVQAVSFFPGTGHLLLTACLDGRVKVWDVYGAGRPLRRSYLGHTGAVRDARFSADGARIASASFDRRVAIWDTETGACSLNIDVGAVPYCAAWRGATGQSRFDLCLSRSSCRRRRGSCASTSMPTALTRCVDAPRNHSRRRKSSPSSTSRRAPS